MEKRFPLLSVSIAALEVTAGEGLTVDSVMEGLLRTKSAAKAKPGNVCLLATPHGVFDLAVTPTASIASEPPHTLSSARRLKAS